MAEAYDPRANEQKWQRGWLEEGTYQIDPDSVRS